MEKDSNKFFREVNENVVSYVEAKLELLKLSTYERIGKVTTVLSFGLVLMFLGFFAVLFIFIALGYFLGEKIGSVSAGFSIVAALYLLVMGVILMFRKQIKDKVLNIIIGALMANDEKEDESGNKQSNSPTETDF